LRKVVPSKRFQRDVKRAAKRGLHKHRLVAVIDRIQAQGTPAASCRPHQLRGVWSGFMECHIGFDWLLTYQVDDDEVRLYRTGTHSDLFG
jgi:mRNA interferase YafQ